MVYLQASFLMTSEYIIYTCTSLTSTSTRTPRINCGHCELQRAATDDMRALNSTISILALKRRCMQFFVFARSLNKEYTVIITACSLIFVSLSREAEDLWKKFAVHKMCSIFSSTLFPNTSICPFDKHWSIYARVKLEFSAEKPIDLHVKGLLLLLDFN